MNIIAIDDDRDLLILMRYSLSGKGIQVAISVNGINLHKLISEHRPRAILLDLTMKGINGADICKALKADKTTADIPVVLVSGDPGIETIMASCGADGFIRKPFSTATVADHLFRLTAAA